MKAKEYFKQYKDMEAGSEELNQFKNDFLDETKDLIRFRHVKTDLGLEGIINELNQKWNAVYNLFVKKNGTSPIEYNGFRAFIADQVSGLRDLFELKPYDPERGKIMRFVRSLGGS